MSLPWSPSLTVTAKDLISKVLLFDLIFHYPLCFAPFQSHCLLAILWTYNTGSQNQHLCPCNLPSHLDPLYSPFLLPEMLFPWITTWLISSPSSGLCSNVIFGEAFPDALIYNCKTHPWPSCITFSPFITLLHTSNLLTYYIPYLLSVFLY